MEQLLLLVPKGTSRWTDGKMTTQRTKKNFSLSRILFESLVSIRFISNEIVPAEIAAAENLERA